jgi:DNA-binding CsgD family transcriptional regulator
MNLTDDRDLAAPATVAVVFGLMAILVAIDLVTDVLGGTSAFHVLLEGTVVAIGLVASGVFALRVRELVRDARGLRAQLDASQQEARKWRRDAASLISGLSAAIDQQFTRWELSPAEREVALLLLKGLSHKEIANIRNVNETTVRQQARALYRKANLSGRNDLAAFFLEDLLVPRT